MWSYSYPKCEVVKGKKIEYIYMNCGSVSITKENGYNGYMIINDNNFIWKDIDGNIKSEYQK